MGLPNTMMAVVTRGHGGLEQLDLTEVPVPRPDPGWVVVEVSACGLNNTDIWVREGRYGTDRDPHAVTSTRRKPGNFPIVQGVDVVGRIVTVGKGVAATRIGERVLCNFWGSASVTDITSRRCWTTSVPAGSGRCSRRASRCRPSARRRPCS